MAKSDLPAAPPGNTVDQSVGRSLNYPRQVLAVAGAELQKLRHDPQNRFLGPCSRCGGCGRGDRRSGNGDISTFFRRVFSPKARCSSGSSMVFRQSEARPPCPAPRSTLVIGAAVAARAGVLILRTPGCIMPIGYPRFDLVQTVEPAKWNSRGYGRAAVPFDRLWPALAALSVGETASEFADQWLRLTGVTEPSPAVTGLAWTTENQLALELPTMRLRDFSLHPRASVCHLCSLCVASVDHRRLCARAPDAGPRIERHRVRDGGFGRRAIRPAAAAMACSSLAMTSQPHLRSIKRADRLPAMR
jgi:hypothetical protein